MKKRNPTKCVRALKLDIRGRFEDVTLANYEAGDDDYTLDRIDARTTMEGIVARLDEFMAKRHGLIIHGAVGTGKDHLAIGLLKHLADAGYLARWIDGTQFYAAYAEAWADKTRQELLWPLIKADALVVSDPVLRRNWTQSKSDAFARIVRGRYDKGKPTWVTVNAKVIDDVSKEIGPDVLSRLKDKAVIRPMTFPSWRQPVAF